MSYVRKWLTSNLKNHGDRKVGERFLGYFYLPGRKMADAWGGENAVLRKQVLLFLSIQMVLDKSSWVC